jgi:hypothetical protein
MQKPVMHVEKLLIFKTVYSQMSNLEIVIYQKYKHQFKTTLLI